MPPKLILYVINSKLSAGRLQNIMQLKELLKCDSYDEIALTLVSEHETETINQQSVQVNTDFSQLPADAPQAAAFNPLIVPVHVRHVSNFFNHRAALNHIAGASDGDYHVVIEDDVVFGDKVGETLQRALTAFAPADNRLVFLGLPSAQAEDDADVLGDFRRYYNVSPVCDSYAVTPAAAAAIAKDFARMKFTTNIQLSYAVHVAAATAGSTLAAGFARPNVFIDGSKLGVFVSTIEVNNNLILSSEHQQLKTLSDAGDAVAARAYYDTMRFKNHVDNVKLMAYVEHKAGNLGASKALFEACYQSLSSSSSGTVLNNQSVFLRSYITACKDFAAIEASEQASTAAVA
jgi:GR25 family glycosyltransferase involved in LPS biosynthesis